MQRTVLQVVHQWQITCLKRYFVRKFHATVCTNIKLNTPNNTAQLWNGLISITGTQLTEKRPFFISSSALKVKRNFESSCNEDDSDDDEDDIHDDEDVSEDIFLEEQREYLNKDYILPSSGHKVFIIQPDFKHISWYPKRLSAIQHQLDEACTLVESLPLWSVSGTMIQNIKHYKSKEIFGKGSFEELKGKIRSTKNISAVYLNIEMLSGGQLATLQNAWKLPVYDRFTIVLQIFKTRATTKEAKLQVALAELPYYRSRMKGLHMGTLDQQRGGMSYIGGSGEKFLELRKRVLQEKEIKIKKALEKVKERRSLLRKDRIKKEFPIVAVVGYTNAGKTSLIKALTCDESMEPKDQLFATLDVTVHAGIMSNRMKVLFVDTVGFISDIPTNLIASFSSTLEDALNADVILHVRDISHPDTLAQKHNVLTTLDRLHLPQKLRDSVIEISNKIDLIKESSLNEPVDDNSITVSATTGYGLDELKEIIQNAVVESTGRVHKCMKVPMNGPHLRWLYKEGTVEDTRSCDDNTEYVLVDVILTTAAYAKFVHQFGTKTQKQKLKTA